MLAVESVSKRLGKFQLAGASFTVRRGEYFVLLGASGAGKTVLLETICGLIDPDDGRIVMDGEEITEVPCRNRGIGLVYQDHALFPHMTVAANVGFALRCQDYRGDGAMEIDRLLELTGAPSLKDRRPETLSVGEKQRVALARTLAMKPALLLLDEPLASLDVQSKAAMRALLRRLNKEGQTIVHVTHDYDEAIALADTIAVMENDTIAQVGPPDQVFQRPKTQFVANFAGIKNFFKGEFTRTSPNMGTFRTETTCFDVASDADSGYACAILRSEDVTVSKTRTPSSARNQFTGTVVDVEPGHLGIEVYANVGVTLVATITRGSLETMNVKPGDDVCLSFKATAVRLLKE